MQTHALTCLSLLLCCTFVAAPAVASTVERGEQVYRRCQACHTLEPGGHQARGPNLFGLFGREAGTIDGYAFSRAFSASDVVWTDETLDRFLAEPRTFIGGNKMASPAIRQPEDRAALIAFLREATQ